MIELTKLPPPVLMMAAIAVVVMSIGLTVLIVAILVSESAYRRFIHTVYAIKKLKETDTKHPVRRRNLK
jgi:hypothetical protein